jgi:hypothetical protein
MIEKIHKKIGNWKYKIFAFRALNMLTENVKNFVGNTFKYFNVCQAMLSGFCSILIARSGIRKWISSFGICSSTLRLPTDQNIAI